MEPVQPGDAANVETSNWMITNESPDGYSIMHVLGSTLGTSVGDIVALRPENGSKWQVCIIRWAQSENQEHLEFGLQILATDATPPCSSPHRKTEPTKPILGNSLPSSSPDPATPPRRNAHHPSGLLEEQPAQLVPCRRKGNIEVREVRTRLNEQNGQIEVFSNPTESSPSPFDHYLRPMPSRRIHYLAACCTSLIALIFLCLALGTQVNRFRPVAHGSS